MNSISGRQETLQMASVHNTVTINDKGTAKGMWQYHEDELNMHKKINNTAVGIIISGFTLIAISFIYMMITQNTEIGTITTIAGIVTEFISGVLFWFVTKASDDKWKYFNALNSDEEEKRMIKLIKGQSSEEFQQRMVEKMVDTYCKKK